MLETGNKIYLVVGQMSLIFQFFKMDLCPAL